MFESKRNFLSELMLGNARENARKIGFSQCLVSGEDKVTLSTEKGSYDVSDCITDTDKIDFGKRIMLEFGCISEEAIALSTKLLSRFPEGSQMAFCHKGSEEICHSIFSEYGIKIYEHVNVSSITRKLCADDDRADDGEALYYCLAVKTR